MLPALLGAGARAAGGQIVKSGGRAMAGKMLGGKKTVKPSAIAPRGGVQQQRQKRGGGLVKSPTAAIAKQMAPIKQISTSKVAKDDHLGIIHEKVLMIENILKGVRDAEKDNVKQKKKAEQDENRANQEKKLEAKDDKPDKKKLKMPPVPQLGIFGWIKRFIGNVVAAIFLSKMVDHVGMLVGFVKVADKILNFVADVGIKLVDALGTMVEFGYRAYDATRGFLQTIGGNGLAQNFDKIMGLVGTALTLATAITLDAAMDAADGGGYDGPGLLDFIKGKGAAKGATAAKGAAAAKGTAAAATGTAGGGAAGTAGTVGGLGLGAVVAIVSGAGLLSSALGEGVFQLRKLGKTQLEQSQRVFDKTSWLNPMKYFFGAGLLLAKGNNFLLQMFGHLFDLIGAPFRYAVELALFGIMSLTGDTEGIKRQRKNLAKFDARVRESIREMYNIMTFGLLGQFFKKGDFGNIFGDDKAQAEMMKEYSEGGKVKGSKGKAKRRLRTRKKPKKLILRKPPRESIDQLPAMTGKGDDAKQKQNKERAWWDFLGWAGTGEGTPLGPAGQQLAEKVRNVGNELGKNDYFGPILRVTSKMILNQEVDQQDYRRVAMGMNLMINEGLKKGKVNQGMFAFNEGGLSDAAGVRPIDASTWIEDTFGSMVRSERSKDFMGTTGSRLFTETSGTSGTSGEVATMPPSTPYVPGAGPQLGSSTAPEVAESAHAGFKNIYNLAKQAGDPFPELTAAQWAIESGYGSSKTGKNNPFGQTGTHPQYGGTTLATPRDPGGGSKTFMNFGSELEAVQFRVKRWVPEYGNATTPYEALMNIQKHGGNMRYAQGFPTAAFPDGDWMGYVRSVSQMMKDNGMDPYRKAKFESTTNVAANGGPMQQIASFFGFGKSENEENETSPQAAPSLGSNPSQQINVSGQGIVAIGKNLISKGFSVAEHPDFTKTPTSSGGKYTPGKGHVSDIHQGRGHYEGRAIDVTDWRGSMEDSKARYRSVLDSLYQQRDKLNLNMLIHNSWGDWYNPNKSKGGPPGDSGHPEHMHIEVKDKGGFIGKGLFANLGGTEFVTDADSTAALRQVAPGLMMALNQATDKAGVERALRQYASYEQGAQQTVMIQNPQMPSEESDFKGSSGSNTLMLGSIPSESPFDFLDYQG